MQDSSAHQFEKLSVLVADDNPHMRHMICEILSAVGVRHPSEAADGDAAWARLRSESVDVVFTNLLMRPVGGIALVARIRSDPASPDPYLPVIVVSGQTTGSAVAEARDAGVNEIVAKPITARAVLERLRLVLEHPRPFVRSPDFFGPDRRRRVDFAYAGPLRRAADKDQVEI